MPLDQQQLADDIRDRIIAKIIVAGGSGPFATASAAAIGEGIAEALKAHIKAGRSEIILTAGNDGAFKETNNTTYTTMGCYAFDGSNIAGIPYAIKAVAYVGSVAGTVDIRIYDSTNGATISEVIEIAGSTQTINAMSAPANIPAGQAIFEIQVRTNSSSTKGRLASIVMEF
jgi:hypothetical protein